MVWKPTEEVQYVPLTLLLQGELIAHQTALILEHWHYGTIVVLLKTRNVLLLDSHFPNHIWNGQVSNLLNRSHLSNKTVMLQDKMILHHSYGNHIASQSIFTRSNSAREW